MGFREIQFSPNFTYSSDSDNIPLEFYLNVFPRAKTVDMFLGYFNSYTFSLLSEAFAEFIYNGGCVRIITNHYYSPLDHQIFFGVEEESLDYKSISQILSNLKKLKSTLDAGGQLFFDCLKFLMKKDRLKIQPVLFRNQLSHKKIMIFNDGDNTVMCNGSMNFTPSGLIHNGESFLVDVSWNKGVGQTRIIDEQNNFERVFNKEHKDYTYLESRHLEKLIDDFGGDKSIEELLQDSLKLNENKEYEEKVNALLSKSKKRFQSIVHAFENEPRFPFSKPRDYQSQAYENWVQNNFNVLFSIATGTGKTFISLNCVLEEYKIHKQYNVIILVPTKILVSQWVEECRSFNFKNVFT